MGGSITAESSVGDGSKFCLRLPRTYSSPVAQRLPGSDTGGYVLLVDDDNISRYIAKEHLERLGWRVLEAADGEMALRLAREGECRAIVLDLVMPGMSGFQVLQRLGDHPETAAIPVFVRTSLTKSDIDAASIVRAAGVFAKSEDGMQSLADAIAAGPDAHRPKAVRNH